MAGTATIIDFAQASRRGRGVSFACAAGFRALLKDGRLFLPCASCRSPAGDPVWHVYDVETGELLASVNVIPADDPPEGA